MNCLASDLKMEFDKWITNEPPRRSVTELANQLGVDHSMFVKVLQGKRTPSSRTRVLNAALSRAIEYLRSQNYVRQHAPLPKPDGNNRHEICAHSAYLEMRLTTVALVEQRCPGTQLTRCFALASNALEANSDASARYQTLCCRLALLAITTQVDEVGVSISSANVVQIVEIARALLGKSVEKASFCDDIHAVDEARNYFGVVLYFCGLHAKRNDWRREGEEALRQSIEAHENEAIDYGVWGNTLDCMAIGTKMMPQKTKHWMLEVGKLADQYGGSELVEAFSDEESDGYPEIAKTWFRHFPKLKRLLLSIAVLFLLGSSVAMWGQAADIARRFANLNLPTVSQIGDGREVCDWIPSVQSEYVRGTVKQLEQARGTIKQLEQVRGTIKLQVALGGGKMARPRDIT